MINNLQQRHNGDVIFLLRKCLDTILLFAIVGEMVFFPSLANVAGCIMTTIVWLIYRAFFLKHKIIIHHPFGSLAFLSIFLARFIPLPATLIEGKPITYGFENPYETFLFETLAFMVISTAFYAAINKSEGKNNVIRRTLYRIGFFKTDARTLWVLGLIGLVARIQNLRNANEVEFGDAGSKFLDGFLYLQYAPIVMLFPTLSGISLDKKKNNFVIFYAVFTFILSLAANSRQQMLYPIFTILLLFLIYLIKENISVFKFISPIKLILYSLLIVFGLSFLQNISLAMLANRNIRGEISRSELFDKTLETMQNEELMNSLRAASVEGNEDVISYNKGWDESYLNNFMLNRYGNMRVVDRTIHYGNIVGHGNKKMQDSYFTKAIAVYPLPVLSALGIKVNKENLMYSPGDMLYYLVTGSSNALGGFRVTSLIGDGLATFGLWCFPILFVLLFFAFRLMDSFVFYMNNTIIYSTLGLINVFGFLGMFRYSIGFNTPTGYILRGFWQQCFMFWLVVVVVKTVTSFKTK